MIRRLSPPNPRTYAKLWFGSVASVALILFIGGCAAPPQKPTGPTVVETANLQRTERAQTNLADGLKKYDSGNYDEAMQKFLLALDSRQLALAEQLTARKHMAFIHCLNGREASGKEEFEKLIALDPKFELSTAEAGHPAWGPVYRLTRTEMELRRSGRALPAPSKSMPAGEKIMLQGMTAYDDADYNKSIKLFQDALKEPLATTDQIAAQKLIAFSYCLTNRMKLCRTTFESIFKLDANFNLTPAEAGHPAWGPSFRTVKAKQQSAPSKKQ